MPVSDIKDYLLTRRLWLAASLFILLLSFALHLHQLGHDSLWIDEMLTLKVVEKGASAIFNQNDHPFVYYLVTAPFVYIFGDGEFGLRLSSFFGSLLSVALMISFGKLIDYPQAGLWGAFLLTLSPFFLRHSQDARHYVILTLFTLLTFNVLYGAIKRPTWRAWLLYGLATALNLYTHYSAFIILAIQMIIIAGWLAKEFWHKRYGMIRYPLTAAFTLLLLYLPWLPHLQHALGRNVGEDIVDNNRQVVPLSRWLINVSADFNSGSQLTPLLVTLSIIGLLYWAWQRKWLSLEMVLAGLILPLPLIGIFDVARTPQTRYVIYMLPFYLLLAGSGIAALLALLHQVHWGAWASGVVLTAVALMFIYTPPLSSEYDFVLNDWRTVLGTLAEKANPQDVIVEMSLNYPSGFNVVTDSLPYYVERLQTQYQHVHANMVTRAEAKKLAQTEARVYGVVMNWGQAFQLDESQVQIQPVQKDIYIVQDLNQTENALANTIELYKQMIPYAYTPSPQCLLQYDLIILAAAAEQWQTAEQAHDQAMAQCPYLASAEGSEPLPIYEIYHGLAQQYLANGQNELAYYYATKVLLEINAHDQPALEILQVENLLDWYQAGDVAIQQNGATDPVQMVQFVMPQNGDRGDVLLLHPPSAVSYQLTLPADPTALFFRMAMAPESWPWGGDGSTFIITVQQDDQPSQELFRHYVSNDPQAQMWHNGLVSLADYAGQSLTITLTTDIGPAADSTGDWAGWDTPRLIWEGAQP